MGSVLKETIAVSGTISISVQKVTQPTFRQQNERNAEVPEARVPSGRMSRWPCKDYLKGTCTTPVCEKWHPPELLVLQVRKGIQIWDKSALVRIASLMNRLAKGLKGMVT